jgi:hypothetical protein
MSNKYAVKNPRCLMSQRGAGETKAETYAEAIVCGVYMGFRVADAGQP